MPELYENEDLYQMLVGKASATDIGSLRWACGLAYQGVSDAGHRAILRELYCRLGGNELGFDKLYAPLKISPETDLGGSGCPSL